MEADVDLQTVNLLPRLQRLLRCMRERNEAETARAATALADELARIRATVASVPGAEFTHEEQQALLEELLRKVREQDLQIRRYEEMISSL